MKIVECYRKSFQKLLKFSKLFLEYLFSKMYMYNNNNNINIYSNMMRIKFYRKVKKKLIILV